MLKGIPGVSINAHLRYVMYTINGSFLPRHVSMTQSIMYVIKSDRDVILALYCKTPVTVD